MKNNSEQTKFLINSKLSGTPKEFAKQLKKNNGDQMKALQEIIAVLKDEVTTLEKLHNALIMANSFTGVEHTSKNDAKSIIIADGKSLTVEASPHVLKYLNNLGLVKEEKEKAV